VHNLLFVFGNTETTPGISDEEMHIRIRLFASLPSQVDSFHGLPFVHCATYIQHTLETMCCEITG
jgi:hypothetical protein